ncbi:MFS transporter [Dissulfurirhabdus thermomarina]|uniref:MFS transporter n=1 Tax=Dissulfurirhabdus thermomarina TaxID=1765737 RepID=A0A6N9TR96_DISTH|nr:MFS transporter [Dissulfurirhabdus thermomarina]NDY42970.1 MFS transporter [Dissulfurirhabdus thermomarina]NMX23951.1 MFS transporter [Dissulfurirhabdus thermomarina]
MPEPGGAPRPPLRPQALAALRQGGFALLLLGQALSLQGNWIQSTAQRWIILEISDAPWILGLMGAVAGLPVLLFSFLGGWMSDRLSRLPVLLAAHALIALQALLFGWRVQTGALTVPEALCFVFLLGCGMAFEVPARQSLVFEMVGRERIANALALHSTAFNLARFAGPAAAGLLMAAGHAAACFYLKAATSAAVAAVLLVLGARGYGRRRAEPAGGGPVEALRSTLSFAWRRRELRTVLLGVAAFSVLLLPYSILLPVFGRDVFGLGAREYGFLAAANGLGALAGAVAVAAWGHLGRSRTWWWTGALAFPATLFAFALAPGYGTAMGLLFLAGAAMVVLATNAVRRLQLAAPDAIRGRLMGLFTSSFMGIFPAGSLLQGALAQWLGARLTLASAALVALALSVSLAWGELRPRPGASGAR